MPPLPRPFCAAAGLTSLWLVVAGPATAQPATTTVATVATTTTIEPAAAEGPSYALGGALIAAPTYAGSGGQEIKLRPLWALRYGRYRLSGSRAQGLLAPPGDSGSGASADLVDAQRWRLGASLRFDSGRLASADPALAGLPDVRRTLRGRVYAALDLGSRWTGQLGYAHDLLGRDGGGTANLGVAYGWQPWPGLAAAVNAGLTLADRQYMQTWYGIPPALAATTGRPAFEAHAGVLDINAGLGLRLPLAGRWLLFGGVNLSRLQGDAAASPITQRRIGVNALVALAWRSR